MHSLFKHRYSFDSNQLRRYALFFSALANIWHTKHANIISSFYLFIGPTKPTQLPPELPPNTHGDQQQQAQLPKHSAKPLLLPPPRADTGLPPGSLGPLGSQTMPMDKSPSSRSYKGHTTSASSHHPKLPPLRQDSQTLFYAPDYSRKSSAPPFLPPSTAR